MIRIRTYITFLNNPGTFWYVFWIHGHDEGIDAGVVEILEKLIFTNSFFYFCLRAVIIYIIANNTTHVS